MGSTSDSNARITGVGICKEHIFKTIFLECNPRVQRFLQSRGVDQVNAADMAQELFLKLWKNCSKVKADSALSFLFKMANNLHIDEVRKQKVKLKFSNQYSRPISSNTPQDVLEESELKTRIENALNEMNESSRVVFCMSRMDGMKYREIAEHLSISIKAVEKRMTKAISFMTEKGILKKR